MIFYTIGLDVRFKAQDEGSRGIVLDGVVNGEPFDRDHKTRLVPVYVPSQDVCVMVNEQDMLWKFRVTLKDEQRRKFGRKVWACDAVAACELAVKDPKRVLEVEEVLQLDHVQ